MRTIPVGAIELSCDAADNRAIVGASNTVAIDNFFPKHISILINNSTINNGNQTDAQQQRPARACETVARRRLTQRHRTMRRRMI